MFLDAIGICKNLQNCLKLNLESKETKSFQKYVEWSGNRFVCEVKISF